jgi:hypothetical protein
MPSGGKSEFILAGTAPERRGNDRSDDHPGVTHSCLIATVVVRQWRTFAPRSRMNSGDHGHSSRPSGAENQRSATGGRCGSPRRRGPSRHKSEPLHEQGDTGFLLFKL